ncbi:MAG: hypothetical protein GC137_04990 [Alphaproteobacteria bacterium]|nr:hypothetical protein [Alphaproteobacteria bacterium]
MKQHIKKDSRFSLLGQAKRVWSLSAIHGDIDRLVNIHDRIFAYIHPGDRLVYTGNYTGYGKHSREVIDEILTFRRAVLAKPFMIPSDLIYLRGAQEEMWQKLLQLQFSPSPMETFLWMLGNGVGETLYSYGLSPHDGITACSQGMVGVSQWTQKIIDVLKQNPGHQKFSAQLVRAALSPQNSEYPMLFVNAGIDREKSLNEQGDSFWWGAQKFDQMEQAYAPYQKVIRGFDPKHRGIAFNCIKATIDAGCGFGGDLACVTFAHQTGEVINHVTN